MFDIVISLGPNDKDVIKNQLKYTRKNVIGYNKIYVISYDPSILLEDDIIVVDEKSFPFKMQDIQLYIGKNERNGWYLQQLLKLYAVRVIPNILENILIIDADTFFVKPVEFMTDNKFNYNFGSQYHIPYFDHMRRLHPNFKKYSPRSGICHHMIFQKKYIDELFNIVETYHEQIFWKVFLTCISTKQYLGSGASEYELYYNYIISNYIDKINIRKLNFKDINLKSLNQYESENVYDYLSCHYHMV